MRLLLLAIALGVGLVYLGVWLRRRRTLGRDRAADLIELRELCEADVTLLGKDLRRLDAEAVPRDQDVLVDLEAARKAHQAAKQAVGSITDAAEIGRVTESLANGRYALACVQARKEGHAVPAPRVPCFFNPQHGPSVYDVAFTPAGHGTHKVPACANDVARVRAKEEPAVREVEVDGRRVPYFEAGSAFSAYGAAYFTGETAIQALFTTSTSWPGEGRQGFAFDPLGVRPEGYVRPWQGRRKL